MRVGVVRHAFSSLDGGSHYETVFLDALSEIATRFPAEFVFLVAPDNDLYTLAATGNLNYRGLPIRAVREPVFQQGPPETYLKIPPPAVRPQIDPNSFHFDREAAIAHRKAGIDLIVQLGPLAPPFASLLPFVMPIYDLNHRLQPEFPEVNIQFHWREYLYANTCRFATLILVDSEAGKEDVLRFYGNLIDEDRIRILRYYPPIEHKALPAPEELSRVAAKYRLPKRFFFYPAQFWRHKNHALILRAVRRIADETGESVPVVFCGAYTDYFRALNFTEVRTLAGQLGVTDRVFYLGVVPDEDMAALYSLSAGLVMPTFFGPTNLPPLEAWHYGRPVITSDIRGLREQTGDAGLLVDPTSPSALAQAMIRLWRDETLGAELAARGRKRLSSYGWNDFVECVAAIMTEACERVRTGRTPRFPSVDLR